MRTQAQLAPEVEAGRQARDLVRDEFAASLPRARLADLLTVVTELVDNAVAHGRSGPISLSIKRRGPILSGRVENPGHGPVEIVPIDLDSQEGLGLHIVEAIVDNWTASVADGRVSVDFELALD